MQSRRFVRCFIMAVTVVFMPISLSLTGFAPAHAAAQQDPQAEHARTQRELQSLQNEIQQRRQSIERRQQRLSSGERDLRNLETQVQSAARQLRETELKIASVEGHIYELEQEQARLQTQVIQQAEALAAQIESAYKNGQHGFLKLLLNQINSAKLLYL